MKAKDRLTIGLPDGAHIRKLTFDLLQSGGMNVDGYNPNSPTRKYKTSLVLPSGAECDVIVDKPRDLLTLLAMPDLIITGEDYLQDYGLFFHNAPDKHPIRNYPFPESAHIDLRHLGYFGTQLFFMLEKSSPYNSLEQLIIERDNVICYTEFPQIAANHIMRSEAYTKKYGYSSPAILSSFSSGGTNKDVQIFYSNGSTESKAANNPDVLILELTLTGKSARDNNLKTLEKVGDKIFTRIYRSGNPDSIKQRDASAEFVEVLESTVKKHHDSYVVEKLIR